MTRRMSLVRCRAVILPLILLCACSDRGGSRSAGAGGREDAAQADADVLGRDLFDIMDRVMSYRSSHRGRLPASLRQAGIDSLSPETVRRLAREGNDPVLTVVFRRTDARQLVSCRGTNQVLEEAMLNDGVFPLACTTVDGVVNTYHVSAKAPAP